MEDTLIYTKLYATIFIDAIAFLILIKKQKFFFNHNILYILILFILILWHSCFFSFKQEESILDSLKGIFVIFSIVFSTSLIKINVLIKLYKNILQISTLCILISSDLLLITHPESAYYGNLFQGIYANPNSLALCISVLLMPYYINNIFNVKSKYLHEKVILINLFIILFLTGSRTGLLVSVIILIIVLLKNYKSTKLKHLILGTLIGFILIVFSNNFIDFIDKGNKDSLLTTRSMLYENRIEGIYTRPYTGWGYQVNEFHYADEHNDFKQLEKGNTYLALIEEFGLFLGPIIIIILIKIYLNSLKLNTELYFISLIILASLIHSNSETWIFIMHGNSGIAFWMSVIIMYRLIKKVALEHK